MFTTTQNALARFRNGDSAPLGKLLLRYQEQLLRFIKRVASSRGLGIQEPEDIAQGAVCDGYRNLEEFEWKSKGCVLAFLFQIVRMKIVDAYRREKSNQNRLEGFAKTQASEAKATSQEANRCAEDSETRSFVESTLLQLPPEMCSLLREIHQDGRGIAEVAAELSIHPNTLRSRLQRADKEFLRVWTRSRGIPPDLTHEG